MHYPLKEVPTLTDLGYKEIGLTPERALIADASDGLLIFMVAWEGDTASPIILPIQQEKAAALLKKSGIQLRSA